ncbi:MAG: hypothetical protein HY712_00980 [candidate division NC10 bacterium]|nr:hypothetical protein [candidate division NC10 bacterium]
MRRLRRLRDLDASLAQGIAVWVGWILFGITLLNTLALAFSGWAVSARALGVRDMGRGLFFAGFYAATLTASVNLALFCTVLAAGAWFFSGRAALWLLAAALMSGLPLGLLTLLGR